MSQNLDELYEAVQKHKGEPGFMALEVYTKELIERYRDKLERGESPEIDIRNRGRLKECRDLVKLLTE